MPPMAPATPPKIPPWAKVRKFSADMTALSFMPFFRKPSTIQTTVMMTVGSSAAGCRKVSRMFLT